MLSGKNMLHLITTENGLPKCLFYLNNILFKDLPGCLFTRTFLLKSSYTFLHMLKCLKMHASPFNKFNMWDCYGNIKLSLWLHIYL